MEDSCGNIIFEDASYDFEKIYFKSRDEVRVFVNNIFWDDDDFDAFDITWEKVLECMHCSEFYIVEDNK